MKKKILVTVAAVILIAIAVFLLADRMIPKAFSNLCPNIERLESCQIIGIVADESKSAMLKEDGLDALLSELESIKYSKQGTYGSVMEGNIVTLFFSAKGEEVFSMHISDTGKVYIGNWCYEVASSGLSDYMKTVLQ